MEQNFSCFFYLFCLVFPGDAASASESSRTKFSRQTEKASVNFSGAKIRGAHFPAGGIFVSGLAGQQPRAQRFPTASTFLPVPTGQHLPFTFSSRSGHPVNRQMLFCSFGFPDAKTRGAYFCSIQNHRFRLDRPISANPLFIPAIQSPTRQFISFRRQPADSLLSYFFTEPNASRPSAHSLPAPAGQYLPPPFFSYRPSQSSISQLLPPGLAGRRLTFLPTTFLISTKHHLPTKYRFPPFFQNPPITIFPNILPTHLRHLYITIPSFHTSSFFYFLYRRHPPGFRLSVPPTPISSHHFPNALHFFRTAAASPTRRPNAKRSFARGCSLQGCRWCGRGARVSFFSFFFYFFLLLSFLSPFSSPWRRGFAATPSFFFLFFLFYFCFFLSFCFCSSFCFFFLLFCFYFCFFLFAFFSLFLF